MRIKNTKTGWVKDNNIWCDWKTWQKTVCEGNVDLPRGIYQVITKHDAQLGDHSEYIDAKWTINITGLNNRQRSNFDSETKGHNISGYNGRDGWDVVTTFEIK